MMQMAYARGIKRPILIDADGVCKRYKETDIIDADAVCKRYKERCRWRMQENIQNG